VSLVLQAVEVRGPSRWRWLLTDEGTGNPLADHEVALDPDAAEVRAFGDVYGYARSYAAPGRWAEDEARLVSELGEWAGRALLGERIGATIIDAAPVTDGMCCTCPGMAARGRSCSNTPTGHPIW
jgi:hypothetical protein